MTYLLVQTTNASSNSALCSGRLLGDATGNCMAINGGTPGTVEDTPLTLPAFTANRVLYTIMSATNQPGVTTWESGTWTVPINHTTGNVSIVLKEVYICRLNSAGVSVGTVTNRTGLALETQPTGVDTIVFTNVGALTVDASNRIGFVFVYSNSFSMPRSIGITPDQTITTPISPASTMDWSGRSWSVRHQKPAPPPTIRDFQCRTWCVSLRKPSFFKPIQARVSIPSKARATFTAPVPVSTVDSQGRTTISSQARASFEFLVQGQLRARGGSQARATFTAATPAGTPTDTQGRTTASSQARVTPQVIATFTGRTTCVRLEFATPSASFAVAQMRTTASARGRLQAETTNSFSARATASSQARLRAQRLLDFQIRSKAGVKARATFTAVSAAPTTVDTQGRATASSQARFNPSQVTTFRARTTAVRLQRSVPTPYRLRVLCSSQARGAFTAVAGGPTVATFQARATSSSKARLTQETLQSPSLRVTASSRARATSTAPPAVSFADFQARTTCVRLQRSIPTPYRLRVVCSSQAQGAFTAVAVGDNFVDFQARVVVTCMVGVPIVPVTVATVQARATASAKARATFQVLPQVQCRATGGSRARATFQVVSGVQCRSQASVGARAGFTAVAGVGTIAVVGRATCASQGRLGHFSIRGFQGRTTAVRHQKPGPPVAVSSFQGRSQALAQARLALEMVLQPSLRGVGLSPSRAGFTAVPGLAVATWQGRVLSGAQARMFYDVTRFSGLRTTCVAVGRAGPEVVPLVRVRGILRGAIFHAGPNKGIIGRAQPRRGTLATAGAGKGAIE